MERMCNTYEAEREKRREIEEETDKVPAGESIQEREREGKRRGEKVREREWEREKVRDRDRDSEATIEREREGEIARLEEELRQCQWTGGAEGVEAEEAEGLGLSESDFGVQAARESVLRETLTDTHTHTHTTVLTPRKTWEGGGGGVKP